MTETQSVTTHADVKSLDPFAFIPNLASRIFGLGGEDALSDPPYAFHTPYVPCRSGPLILTIRFRGLHASIGNLTIRVNAMSVGPGAVARTIKMTSKSLSELAEEGEIVVVVEAKPHLLYAVQGLVYGESDAYAEHLEIGLEQSAASEDSAEPLSEAQYTPFGHAGLRGSAHLGSSQPATLENPVTQIYTSAQQREPAFLYWENRLRAKASVGSDVWEPVYVLQVLNRYGMLQSAARGLGFGRAMQPVSALMTEEGCAIVATDLAFEDKSPDREQMASQGRSSHLDFQAQISKGRVASASVADDLRDFDFCWSIGVIPQLEDKAAVLRFVLDSLNCLKVGGLAVHTAAFVKSADLSHDGNRQSGLVLNRGDVERYALELISLGHEVAQVKCVGENGDARGDRRSKFSGRQNESTGVPVGMIVRRGHSRFY